jgi:hypothetical protein
VFSTGEKKSILGMVSSPKLHFVVCDDTDSIGHTHLHQFDWPHPLLAADLSVSSLRYDIRPFAYLAPGLSSCRKKIGST